MTGFEKSVKTELIKRGKNQTWLLEQVQAILNKPVYAPAITRAIKGGINEYPQVKIAIAKVLGIKF